MSTVGLWSFQVKADQKGKLQNMVATLGYELIEIKTIKDYRDFTTIKSLDILVVDLGEKVDKKQLSLLEEICANKDLPILLITTADQAPKISFATTVDDLILEPFSLDDLSIRLSLLKEKSQTQKDKVIKIGELQLNPVSYEVTVGDKLVYLTYKEFQLLEYLMKNRGRVFRRQILLKQIWDYDFFSGMRTVDVHIRRLRAKLGPKYGALIETVHSVGYRFSSYDIK